MPRPTESPLARYLVRRWYRGRPILWLLPLSGLFAVVTALRRWLYRRGWWRVEQLPVPVVVVGNLVAGGAGKTPTVGAIVRGLRRLGWHPGVVSRGYGGRWTGPALVGLATDPADCGDEALLLARSLAVPVAVGRRRVEAARLLLARHTEVDCLVCDDGLQHLALGRDLELVVIDAQRGLGNGARLPAGPLRESPARLAGVSALLLHGGTPEQGGRLGSAMPSGVPSWHFAMAMRPPLPLRGHPGGDADWPAWQGRAVDAVAGIADPERFFAGLESLGLRVERHVFADHHAFVAADLRLPGSAPILMTGKDAVKCEAFATERMWQVPLDAQLPDDFLVWLDEQLEQRHGRKTA